MEWIKLIGIVIIVVGFFYKLDTIATVVLAVTKLAKTTVAMVSNL